jgi:prepilin-type N-terminal cleavage/methylation domain-containing protein
MGASVIQSRQRSPHQHGSGGGGFTLPELLIVIGIIAIVAILAVPALRAMTGSRSTEAAHNQLSALLGRTRSEAIALQQTRGVAFFQDPDTKRVQAVMVKAAQYPSSPPVPGAGAPPNPEIYLDYVPDRDVVQFPSGVGIQMVDNWLPAANPNLRNDDGYLGFNVGNSGTAKPSDGTGLVNGVKFIYGGAILFDGFGRVINKHYGYKFYVEDGAGNKTALSNLAKAWNVTTLPAAVKDFTPPDIVRSQIAFVLYDSEVFGQLEYTDGDVQMDTTVPGGYSDGGNDQAGSPEGREERWLDVNGTAEYVNRFNGTLIRGQ